MRKLNTLIFLSCISFFFSFGFRCNEKPTSKICNPESTRKCTCSENDKFGTGGTGVQTCKEDGSGWNDCSCLGDYWDL